MVSGQTTRIPWDVDNRILGTYRQFVKGIIPESNAKQPANANVHMGTVQLVHDAGS